MKTESYDIPAIKSEPISDVPEHSSCSTSKFAFGWTTTAYGLSQYPVENGIYVSPIEEVANNPYKMLEQKTTDEGLTFQKYPTLLDEQNSVMNNQGASYLPTSFQMDKKEQLLSEDDVLAQLFDLSGMLNDDSPYESQSHDNMLIPVQTPSPTMVTEPTNQIQTEHFPATELSPAEGNNSPFVDNFYYNNNNAHPSYSASPDNGCYGADPLVSLFNEGFSPPNNDLYPRIDSVEKPNDDLQILLDEILAVENLPIETNSFTQDNCYDNNDIPSLPMTIEEETNDPRSVDSNDDHLIPIDRFQFPPPSKKRNSESSMDESPPPSVVTHSAHSSPIYSPHTPPDDDYDGTTPKSSTHKARPSVNLFGQKEDDIIEKLLTPKLGSLSKPITRDKLVTMNVEDFNALLDQVGLTEIEVAFMKEWRRRGKNKMAAQIARKRKRDELSELRDEIELLRRQKAQLKQSAHRIKTTVTSFKRRAQAAEERIYSKYSAAHGRLVSRNTHNIHVTDDGKTMLVPRVSSQVLLV